MIVVDASIVLPALLSTGGAGALAREAMLADPDVHVPQLMDVEVASALRRRVRRGETTPTRARSVVVDLLDLPALRWDHEPLIGRAFELRDDLTMYDAVYVALAEALEAVLLTADAGIAGMPGTRCEIRLLVDS